MVRFLKFILFILLLFSTLEVLSRLVLHYTRIEIQQDYASQGSDPAYHPFNNGRGARGQWPDDHKLSVALFGSSIAEQRALKYEDTWPRILEKKFDNAVRIDNFAAGSLKPAAVQDLVDDLIRRGIRYDAIFLNATILHGDIKYPIYHIYDGSYYRRFIVPKSHNCHFCFFAVENILRWLDANDKTENELILKANRFLKNVLQDPKKLPQETETIRYNVQIRNEMRSQNRLVSFDRELSDWQIRNLNESALGLIDKLQTISKQVIWIPELIYYTPEMHANYSKKFITLIPLNHMKKDSPKNYYLDEKSIFLRSFHHYKAMQATMQNLHIPEIKWHDQFTRLMAETDGLSLDEYHLTEAGAAAFADIIYPQIAHELSPLIHQKAK